VTASNTFTCAITFTVLADTGCRKIPHQP
jgi:hypothetical protein